MISDKIFRWIRKTKLKLKWIKNGRPVIKYAGFHCGCCGRWWPIPFEIPEYDSAGKWWDTWGICPEEHKDSCILGRVLYRIRGFL